MNNNYRNAGNAPRGARGFSIVELMVAMGIAVFLLTGLFTIMQSTHKTSDNERLLAQLQDDERIAMTLLSSVVESAGFYSDALTVSGGASTALPVAPPFATAGQAVFGGTNPYGDTVTLRYQTNAVDNVLSCQGNSVGLGVHTSAFSVDINNWLVCSVDGNNPVPLVENIQSFAVFYGVGSALTQPNSAGAVDAYLPAAAMTAVNWTNVYTVKVIIAFKNPLAGQPGQTSAARQVVNFSRVISIKSRTGINVANYI